MRTKRSTVWPTGSLKYKSKSVAIMVIIMPQTKSYLLQERLCYYNLLAGFYAIASFYDPMQLYYDYII